MRVCDMPGGGPAFPHTVNMGRGESFTFPGVTVRDYLIAHAPPHPQPWFNPVMPKVPAAPVLTDKLTKEESEEVQLWECEQLAISDMRHDVAREYAAAMFAHNKTKYDNEQNMERERYLQWPAAWADEQLKRRARWIMEQANATD